MRILIFSDTPHQRRYIDIVRDAMAGEENVTVKAVMYGETNDVHAAPERKSSISPLLASLVNRPAIKALRKEIANILERCRPYLRGKPVISAWRQLQFRRKYVNTHVFAQKSDLIVLFEDNVQGLTGLTSFGAKIRAIPVVILPDYVPNPAEPARFYLNSPWHDANSWRGRLVHRLAPHWVYTHEGRSLLRLPFAVILTHWLRGQYCPQPWILNSGYADTILLDSRVSYEHYVKLGFHPVKLKVIGGTVDDKLHHVLANKAALRRELFESHNLDETKPLIVCSFPPDQYTASARERFEYPEFKDLCSGWFNAFHAAAQNANILVIPHPRLKMETLAPFNSDRVHISHLKLEEVLPLADLYVACISTTIKWALSLGIPVINYDCYRYAYGDFSSAQGIVEVESLHEFGKALNHALQPARLDFLKSLAKQDAGRWGLVDGRFSERLKQQLLHVHRNRAAPSPTHDTHFKLQQP